jgi:hypothetical protein
MHEDDDEAELPEPPTRREGALFERWARRPRGRARTRFVVACAQDRSGEEGKDDGSGA